MILYISREAQRRAVRPYEGRVDFREIRKELLTRNLRLAPGLDNDLQQADLQAIHVYTMITPH